jgi:hypothetical protein
MHDAISVAEPVPPTPSRDPGVGAGASVWPSLVKRPAEASANGTAATLDVALRALGAAVVGTDDGRVVCWPDPATHRDITHELSTWVEAGSDGPVPGEVAVLEAEEGCLLVTPLRAGGDGDDLDEGWGRS